ncbi:hypothetical protein GLAREA_11266 [Glarea lozoyensis ATCC 20868]|uniref:Uncharacterized protein n=1 Tax=Glarea lozoyensis (strain ATCC 20868 / MF5171) TaxID=1116229 RepID=S3DUC5_GLAL2|nr:uncharacterized protein GLAREA_11266 [Glarea lozoyensis ATCC 20868]EPE35566.1 hypothetical protein GLAREA_11266 [Glarea lozoyensis ATCC 20868]
MAMVLHSKAGGGEIEENIEARYNEIVDAIQLLSVRAQIDRLTANLATLQKNGENTKLELAELDRSIEEMEAAKVAESDRQTEITRTRFFPSVVGDMRLRKLDTQLQYLQNRQSASQGSLADEELEIQTCEASIQQLEATLINGKKSSDVPHPAVTDSSSSNKVIGCRINFLLEELRDVTAFVEQIVCTFQVADATSGKSATVTADSSCGMNSMERISEAGREHKIVSKTAEQNKIVGFLLDHKVGSTEQKLEAALSKIKSLENYCDGNVWLAGVGKRVRAHRMAQEFASIQRTKPDSHIFDAGNSMARYAHAVADAAVWETCRVLLGKSWTITKFRDLYSVNADEVWENREFGEFINIINWKANMTSWTYQGLTNEDMFSAFDLLHKKVMPTMRNKEGDLDKAGFKKDVNYESLKDIYNKGNQTRNQVSNLRKLDNEIQDLRERISALEVLCGEYRNNPGRNASMVSDEPISVEPRIYSVSELVCDMKDSVWGLEQKFEAKESVLKQTIEGLQAQVAENSVTIGHLRNEVHQMLPVCKLAMEVRLRRMAIDNAYRKTRPKDVDLVEAGNKAAHGANAIVAAATCLTLRGRKERKDNISTFSEMYGTSPDYIWTLRRHSPYIDMVNWQADMSSWKLISYIRLTRATTQAFDIAHGKFSNKLKDSKGALITPFSPKQVMETVEYLNLKVAYDAAYAEIKASSSRN